MAKEDLKSLAALQKLLAHPEQLLGLIVSSLAEECIGLIQQGFRDERDPYGDRWEPKQANDGRKTLSGKTGRLKTGWHVKRQSNDEIEIAPSVTYAAPHQNPRAPFKRPRRMMVPDSALGLPPRWEKQLEEAAVDALSVLIGGDGRRVSALKRLVKTNSVIGLKLG